LLVTSELQDAVAGEPKLAAEEAPHHLDVVDRALELVRGAPVADADEERALLAAHAGVVACRDLEPRGDGGPRRRGVRERHAAVALDARQPVAKRAPDARAGPGWRGKAHAAVAAPRRPRHRRRARVRHADRPRVAHEVEDVRRDMRSARHHAWWLGTGICQHGKQSNGSFIPWTELLLLPLICAVVNTEYDSCQVKINRN
jgi:hypothetical protein